MPKNKLVLDESVSFEKAIILLDKNGNGVLPVVDSDNVFVGLITDGDIRKAILNKQLDLEHIINKHPHKMDINTTLQERIRFLKSIHRRHLPLVDKDDKYVDFFVLDDLEFNSKPNYVVIMAGGLGSRLGELTKTTPKPMLRVGKKPILETIIKNFIDHGFNKFYISVNYKSEQIIDYFGDGEDLGVKIKYIHESKRLGTAGALSLIEDEVKAPLLVSNGDVITTLNFENMLDFHCGRNSSATMCVREHEYNVPYGVVESINGKIKALKEKPKVKLEVNTGVYILDPEVVSQVPKDTFFDMPELFELLMEKGLDTYTYKLDEYWVDIGHEEEFNRANEDIMLVDFE